MHAASSTFIVPNCEGNLQDGASSLASLLLKKQRHNIVIASSRATTGNVIARATFILFLVLPVNIWHRLSDDRMIYAAFLTIQPLFQQPFGRKYIILRTVKDSRFISKINRFKHF